MNKSGMNGQALFVKCDISNEEDVQVCNQHRYMTSLFEMHDAQKVANAYEG